jgi:DNA-binding response OmpR family regulator
VIDIKRSILSKKSPIFDDAKIIILSAYYDIQTIKSAYKNGCDDYLKKPFDLEELLIKVQKIDNGIETSPMILTVALSYNMATKSLFFEGTVIELTKKEALLIHLLLSHINMPVPYSHIFDVLYPNEESDMNALRSLIKRLGKKLPDDLIKNVLDQGYIIHAVLSTSIVPNGDQKR